MRCEREKRAEIRRMTSFERFVIETENLVLNSVIYSGAELGSDSGGVQLCGSWTTAKRGNNCLCVLFEFKLSLNSRL